MDNQERNRASLVERIAEQDRIIRRRNQQIENQAHNAREAQRVIDDQADRNYSLATDLAAAVVRAEKAAMERDEYRAMHSEQIKTIARLQKNPCTLTADDITDEYAARVVDLLRKRGHGTVATHYMRSALEAAIKVPRPEGAEDIQEFIEAVTRQPQGLSPAEMADELAASGVRVTGKDN